MREEIRRKLNEKGVYAEKDPYSKIGGYRIRHRRSGEIIKNNLTIDSVEKYALYGDEGLIERKPTVSFRSMNDNNARITEDFWNDPFNRPKIHWNKAEINSEEVQEKVYTDFDDVFAGETPRIINQETNQEINSAKSPSENDDVIAMLEAEEAYLNGEKTPIDDFDVFD